MRFYDRERSAQDDHSRRFIVFGRPVSDFSPIFRKKQGDLDKMLQPFDKMLQHLAVFYGVCPEDFVPLRQIAQQSTMKTIKTPLLLLAAAVLALCTSCAADWTTGDTLAEPQPLVFNATQGELTGSLTRAATSGTWKADGTELVAIQMNNVVRKYKVTSGGALTPYDSDNTFCRTDKSTLSVSAWYPYSESSPSAATIALDQSTDEKQERCNLMRVGSTDVVYGQTTTLQFVHRTARVRLHVYKLGTTQPLTGAKVQFTIANETYTAHEDGNGYYSILVKPSIKVTSGDDFVSITTTDGTYKGKVPADATFSMSMSYDYNFDLKRSLISTTQNVAVAWPDTYTGTPKVTYNGTTLTEGTDYEVSSTQDGYVGTLTITGKGAYTGFLQKEYETKAIPYLTFKASAEQGFKMTLATLLANANKFQYSVGGGAWTMVESGSEVKFGGTNKDLRLRGVSSVGTTTNAAYSSSSSYLSNISFTNSDVDVAASGDIRTLVDYKKYDTTETGSARFEYLFYNCTALTSAPLLPATSLASCCYLGMFYGCTKISSPPALPAKTLSDYCYREMFHGCTSLKTAPKLEATTLAYQCYTDMFYGCTSLETAPKLEATTLASYCYYEMFRGCEALSSAPALPATTLKDYCYYNMFFGCSKLENAPTLDAKTLASNCYNGMFFRCTSLKNAPALPAKTLTDYCYREMFSCTGLTSAPTLDATELAEGCYYGMFISCTFTEAPELPAKTLAKGCYERMFKQCTGLTSAPVLPATTLASSCYAGMFYGCTSLQIAPTLPATTLVYSCYNNMFYNCSALNTVTIKATGDIPDLALNEWLKGVASSGTIHKKSALTLNTNNESGIPKGWTATNDITD